MYLDLSSLKEFSILTGLGHFFALGSDKEPRIERLESVPQRSGCKTQRHSALNAWVSSLMVSGPMESGYVTEPHFFDRVRAIFDDQECDMAETPQLSAWLKHFTDDSQTWPGGYSQFYLGLIPPLAELALPPSLQASSVSQAASSQDCYRMPHCNYPARRPHLGERAPKMFPLQFPLQTP
jgi:hypothetical protein